MGDPRFLGTEQRKRMGAESSHLGMTESSMRRSPSWHQGFEHGVSGRPEEYQESMSPEEVDDYSDGHSQGRRTAGRSDDDFFNLKRRS